MIIAATGIKHTITNVHSDINGKRAQIQFLSDKCWMLTYESNGVMKPFERYIDVINYLTKKGW